MDNEVNIETFKAALAMCGLQMNTPTTELVAQLYQGVKEKNDLFSIKDAAKILAAISDKYPSEQEK